MKRIVDHCDFNRCFLLPIKSGADGVYLRLAAGWNGRSKLARLPSEKGNWSSPAICDGCRACRCGRRMAMARRTVRSSVRTKSRTEQVAEPSSDSALRSHPSLSRGDHSPSPSLVWSSRSSMQESPSTATLTPLFPISSILLHTMAVLCTSSRPAAEMRCLRPVA